jgi:hypothetical protein
MIGAGDSVINEATDQQLLKSTRKLTTTVGDNFCTGAISPNHSVKEMVGGFRCSLGLHWEGLNLLGKMLNAHQQILIPL